MKIQELLEQKTRVVAQRLRRLGIDDASVEKFLRYVKAGDAANVHYDPYGASRNNKISYGKLRYSLFRDLEAKTNNLKTALHALQSMYDIGGPSALYEDVKFSEEMLTEGARIEHPEDLIFTDGSAGAMHGLESLEDLAHSADNVSIKWDGSPALIFGRDEQGRFIMTDKSGWGAKTYQGKPTSSDELAAMMMTRRGDPDMRQEFAAKLKNIWPMFAASVPHNFRGYFWGDLLWFDTPPVKNGAFVFKPNTVTYEVDVDSDLGKKIAKSRAGMVIHQFFLDQESPAQPVKSIDMLDQNQGVLFMTPELKQTPKIEIDTLKIEQAKHYLKRNAQAIDRFLNPDVHRQLKLTDLPLLLKRFINQRVREHNLQHLEQGFLHWIESAAPTKAERIKKFIENNELGFYATMIMFAAITHLKELVVRQLDQQQGPVRAHIGVQPGGEGYVVKTDKGLIKLVNRLGFSAANFSKNG